MLTFARLSRLLAVTILAGVYSSCSSLELGDRNRVWYKEGGTIEERDRLMAAAKVQAAQAHADETPGSPDQAYARAQTDRHATLTVMTAAGWNLVPKSEAGPLEHAKSTKSTAHSATITSAPER